MIALYVTSPGTYAGKSSMCVGLGNRLRRDGFKVGFMKPLSTTAKRVEGKIIDEDVEFMKKVFQLEEDLETLAPVCLDSLALEAIFKGKGDKFEERILEAYKRASKGKDIMILEGGASLTDGALVGLPSQKVAELLGAQELVIVKYTDDLFVNSLLLRRELYGESMLGAVVSTVPKQSMNHVKELVVPFLEKRGIRVYATLPRERVLLSMSVGELVEVLGARVLCCEDKFEELVENVMVGAMSVDSALSYFRCKPNKAVITGGDRTDIQLAALETSTKCIILTGNLSPNSLIVGHAEELGVPLLLATQDTFKVVEIIEKSFGRSRFRQEQKIKRFEELLEEHFDFKGLYKGLGLKKKKS